MGDTNTNKEDISKLKGKFDVLDTKISHITKTMMELTAKIDRCLSKGSGEGGSKIADEEWSLLKKTLEAMKKEIADIVKEMGAIKDIQKKINYIERVLDTKLDREEFEKWKNNPDFSQLLAGLVKKFADRNEMLKALRQLEKRILMLEELLSKGDGETCENAMIMKKPLGGWSCASCEKDLINIEGVKVPYLPWAKLPKRDPVERIAKVKKKSFLLS